MREMRSTYKLIAGCSGGPVHGLDFLSGQATFKLCQKLGNVGLLFGLQPWKSSKCYTTTTMQLFKENKGREKITK